MAVGEVALLYDCTVDVVPEVTIGAGALNSPCARIDSMTSISPLGSTPLLCVTAPNPARTDLSEKQQYMSGCTPRIAGRTPPFAEHRLLDGSDPVVSLILVHH